MLVLGRTADDKGAQLEGLIGRVLTEQGYQRVRVNVVGAGGNEVDVVAERHVPIVGGTQVVSLLCEAKAYADPVNMPTWQKFLGKLFIARTEEATAVGLLVALNGVNGNVSGSLKSLQRTDSALFMFEGADLAAQAVRQRELADQDAVRALLQERFHRAPVRLEEAYYGGAFLWVATWNDDTYSVVDGHGQMLPTDEVERLRPALEGSLTGTLLATDEARADAEGRHSARLELMNRLLKGEPVPVGGEAGQDDAVVALAAEPFTSIVDERLVLQPARELDADAIARLFLSMFEDVVRVRLLSFMAERYHSPYIERLVQLMPDLHAGFALEEDEARTLEGLAIPFPSVWVTIASGNPMITTHRADSDLPTDEAVLASERTAFWESIFAGIRRDYADPLLRGFLYDWMDVAEVEEQETLQVKTKQGPLGESVQIAKRNAVRRWAGSGSDEPEPAYVMVRLLPNIGQPWDDVHPEPAFPLDEH